MTNRGTGKKETENEKEKDVACGVVQTAPKDFACRSTYDDYLTQKRRLYTKQQSLRVLVTFITSACSILMPSSNS